MFNIQWTRVTRTSTSLAYWPAVWLISSFWLIYAWSSQIVPTLTHLTLFCPPLSQTHLCSIQSWASSTELCWFLFSCPSSSWLIIMFASQKLRALPLSCGIPKQMGNILSTWWWHILVPCRSMPAATWGARSFSISGGIYWSIKVWTLGQNVEYSCLAPSQEMGDIVVALCVCTLN